MRRGVGRVRQDADCEFRLIGVPEPDFGGKSSTGAGIPWKRNARDGFEGGALAGRLVPDDCDLREFDVQRPGSLDLGDDIQQRTMLFPPLVLQKPFLDRGGRDEFSVAE